MKQRQTVEGDQPSILNWLRGRHEQYLPEEVDTTGHERTTLMTAYRFYRGCLPSKRRKKEEGFLVGMATTSDRLPRNPVMRVTGRA